MILQILQEPTVISAIITIIAFLVPSPIKPLLGVIKTVVESLPKKKEEDLSVKEVLEKKEK